MHSKKRVNEAKQNVKPELFRSLLDNIELMSISLDSIQSSLSRDRLYEADKTKLKITHQNTMTKKKDCTVINSEIVLALVKPKGKKNLFEITAVYELVYTSRKELPYDFWILLSEFSMPVKIWPYFRELVQNITARMNIPPLTLPYIYK